MFGCYNFFRRESTLETKSEIFWDQHAYSTCSGLKTLYVCNFYNPDEGDAISLEYFERSFQWIGGNTSSDNLDCRRHEPPWIWLEAQLPISNVSFPWANLKIRWLSWRSWLSLHVTYNQSYVGLFNVLDLFITNGSLTIKTRVIRGIIDHDAVFVEGINIKATLNKQKRRMFPCIEKQTGVP